VSLRRRDRPARPGSRRVERGLTLVELMVSLALLTVTVALALKLYDSLTDSFKMGEIAAKQQQSVRIGVRKIGADLEAAGANHNPDGDTSRPDEQIEAAFDTAIVFRADFDHGDPTRSGTPESALAGGAFGVVSTGNDEIVVYALAKPDLSSTGTLTFDADVMDSPRDGVVETVSVPHVALLHDDPPYTLYRMTLSNDVGQWGSSDFIVREVLAEGVGSLRFRYFDAAGHQINSTYDLTTISDDIGGAESDAALRARIRRVEFELVGLASDPDPDWIDRSDPDPKTRSFHKYALAGTARPRNLGMVGTPDDGSIPGGGGGYSGSYDGDADD
jgi:prepilin-type N-terminal cleavage/methylation domain-containing protein